MATMVYKVTQNISIIIHNHHYNIKVSKVLTSESIFCYLMDPTGDVLLAGHEDHGHDFFCMISTNMTRITTMALFLFLKVDCLPLSEISPLWDLFVTEIMESLLTNRLTDTEGI